MTTNFYDVVVLGTKLGPLLAATLLAKRGFRVLVLGQDEVPPTYDIAGVRLPRAPFAYTLGSSPMMRRMLHELALSQLTRRRVRNERVAFQLTTPQMRFDVGEGVAIEREIEREFPEIRRAVEDFHRNVAHANADVDALLERDLIWPPETFWERRAFERAISQPSFQQRLRDPFAELPESHPFRRAVEMAVRFDEEIDPTDAAPLRTMRLYGARMRSNGVMDGGESTLRELLIDKLRTHSGELRDKERATHVIVRRGAAAGIRIASSDEEIGCAFVLSGIDVSRLLRLMPDRRPYEELFEHVGEPQARWYRYTLNVVIASEGLPEGMDRDVFFMRDPRRSSSAENLLHVQNEAGADPRTRLLTVSALLPRRSIEDTSGYLQNVRERVFASLGELIPFLGRHCELIDSPHDGRPAQDVRTGRIVEPAEPWTRGPQTMSLVYAYPVTRTLGLTALPLRSPVKHVLHVNSQVVPGLGIEGSLLAAWSAARVVTRADRHKAWLRGRLWNKVEI